MQKLIFIKTRKFKKQIFIYKAIISVYQLHLLNIYHGDIKSSNFLISSTGHLFIGDIASYKPYYLLEDDLDRLRSFFGDFQDFCYLAPEKFICKDSEYNI